MHRTIIYDVISFSFRPPFRPPEMFLKAYADMILHWLRTLTGTLSCTHVNSICSEVYNTNMFNIMIEPVFSPLRQLKVPKSHSRVATSSRLLTNSCMSMIVCEFSQWIHANSGVTLYNGNRSCTGSQRHPSHKCMEEVFSAASISHSQWNALAYMFMQPRNTNSYYNNEYFVMRKTHWRWLHAHTVCYSTSSL